MIAALRSVPFLTLPGFFLVLLGCVELGRRIRQRGNSGDIPTTGLIETAVYALLGLLLALSFSSAAKQFEERRALIVEEANATGTVRLSISLAPQDLRPGLNMAMDRYQASRRASHEVAGDESAFRKRFAATQALQRELWSHAVEAASQPDASPGVNMLLLPALNRLFDLATVRAMALTTHMPDMVFIVIGIGVIIASVLTGFSQGAGKGRSWLHVVAFTSLMALVCYTIMDLEYPRLGIIRIEAFEAKLPS